MLLGLSQPTNTQAMPDDNNNNNTTTTTTRSENKKRNAKRNADEETGASVRLVAVPSFAKTGQLVLLNLRTMQCQLMHFGAWRGGGDGDGGAGGGEQQ